MVVNYAPKDIDGDWTDSARSEFEKAILSRLEDRLPEIKSKIIATDLMTPSDIEREYGVQGGHIYHGEPGLDQILIRPTPECSQYRTPIEGLTLCGSGTHPGGGIFGASGSLGAQAFLG